MHELAPRAQGLCARCCHRELVRSPRHEYLRCRRSDSDARFPRYPRLPVTECSGFAAGTPVAAELPTIR